MFDLIDERIVKDSGIQQICETRLLDMGISAIHFSTVAASLILIAMFYFWLGNGKLVELSVLPDVILKVEKDESVNLKEPLIIKD